MKSVCPTHDHGLPPAGSSTGLPFPSRREFVAGVAGLAAGFLFQSSSAAQTAATASAKPHRIDVHCHFVAPVYLEFLKKNGNPGIAPPPWEVNKHLEDMNQGGTATSIVSLPRPGIWYGDVAGVRKIAREVNEYNAKLIADHPGRFGMFATCRTAGAGCATNLWRPCKVSREDIPLLAKEGWMRRQEKSCRRQP